MSKRGYITRYLVILKKLKQQKFCTFKEIDIALQNKLENLQMLDDDLVVGLSKRTFQRDIKEISNLFGIIIQFSKKQNAYYIVDSDSEQLNFQKTLETYEMLSILKASREMSGYVFFENKPSNGNSYFNVFLSAIKNSFIVNFEYKKFFEHHSTSRSVEPIALKEYKNRWYVLAKDLKDNYIKTFSLDRVIQPIISKNKFQKDTSFNIDKYFEYAYGITSPDEEKSYNIVLSFTPFQGKYIKSLPLHTSQKILIDNEDELRVQLTIYITHEFIMDILSYGSNVKVISPKKLVKEIVILHKKALNNYEI